MFLSILRMQLDQIILKIDIVNDKISVIENFMWQTYSTVDRYPWPYRSSHSIFHYIHTKILYDSTSTAFGLNNKSILKGWQKW